MPDDLMPTPEDYAIDPREVLEAGCHGCDCGLVVTSNALPALARRLIAAEVEVARLRAELAGRGEPKQ